MAVNYHYDSISSFLTLVRYYFFYQQSKSAEVIIRARHSLNTPHLGELLLGHCFSISIWSSAELSPFFHEGLSDWWTLKTYHCTDLCMYHKTLHRILYVLPRLLTSFAINVHYRIKHLGLLWDIWLHWHSKTVNEVNLESGWSQQLAV